MTVETKIFDSFTVGRYIHRLLEAISEDRKAPEFKGAPNTWRTIRWYGIVEAGKDAVAESQPHKWCPISGKMCSLDCWCMKAASGKFYGVKVIKDGDDFSIKWLFSVEYTCGNFKVSHDAINDRGALIGKYKEREAEIVSMITDILWEREKGERDD